MTSLFKFACAAAFLSSVLMPSTLGAQDHDATTSALACADDRASGSNGSCAASETLPGPFIVFFPWGQMGVDEDGAMIVDDAASSFTDGLAIMLTGHSDRSGPAAVNRRISQRRAEAVRDALIDRGVPAEVIAIEAEGEAALLIGTSDGVREAQNRRVEILFSRAAE